LPPLHRGYSSAFKIKTIWIKASKEFCASKKLNVVNWVGYVDSMGPSDDGSVSLELDIDVHDNEVHDYEVAVNLHNVIAELKDGGMSSKGELVRFSGKFYQGKRSENECLGGSILSDSKLELYDNNFKFTFTKIERMGN